MVRKIIGVLPPMHPGEVLREEFLKPMNMAAGRLAEACGVPRTRVERIAGEKLGITGDTAVRLGKVLGTTPEFWMNLQSHYEIETAKLAIGPALEKISQLDKILQAEKRAA
ncbi:MAG: HigA family addiction module antidote protein [Hyphomicrobiales bacterium]|nr:HigA family addiction module antidote protein [Hyphomicrobiales bacterium]MBV9754313.1 HigA family addiction module antidote protein [Hyphomicrobiales bacterium]